MDKFKEETEAIKEYWQKKKEVTEARKGLGKLAYLRHLPYPQQAIGGIVILVFAVVALGFFPQVVDFILMNWIPTHMIDNRGLFLVACGWALVSTALFAVVFIFGGPHKQFLKARFLHKDVIELMTTSGKKLYKNQTEEVGGVYELTDDKAVEVDPNSFYSGPGGVRMTTAMPELPITFNPRKLVEGYGLGLDMMTLKTYGIKHEQKQWEKMKSNTEWLKSLMLPLIIVLVIGLILGPFFYSKMNQDSKIDDLQNKYESCRIDLIDAGVKPKYVTTTTLKGVDVTAVKEASTGASVSKGGFPRVGE